MAKAKVKTKKEEVLELLPLIAKMRKDGKEYRDIAKDLGAKHGIQISHVAVWKIFTAALQVKADTAIGEFRQAILDNYMFELERLEKETVKSSGKKIKKITKKIVLPSDITDDDGRLLAKKGQTAIQEEIQEWEEGINPAYIKAKLQIFSDIRTMLGIDVPTRKDDMPGGGGGAASQTRISILRMPSNGREVTNIPKETHDE